jgi:lysozyme
MARKKATNPETAAPLGTIKTSSAAINFIHQWESCRLTAYPDPGSKDGTPWTIGWGTTVIDGKPVERGMRITQERANELFVQDLVRFEREVIRLTTGVDLTQNQFDALVSFVYNVGPAAFAGSTLRRMILAKDFAAAQLQFTRWNRNDGKAMRGLTRRRFGEAVMFGPRASTELRPLLPSGVLLHLA